MFLITKRSICDVFGQFEYRTQGQYGNNGGLTYFILCKFFLPSQKFSVLLNPI